MNWLGVIVGLIVVGIIVYLATRKRGNDDKPRGMVMPVHGLGAIHYTEGSLGLLSPAKIAAEDEQRCYAVQAVWQGVQE